MSGHRPTPEQQAIIEAYLTGGHLVIEAGAGTGKTSTLKMLAAATPGRRGIYVAYNRAIADDAKASFPSSVTCATAHSLAFRAVGRQFADRLNGPRLPARETARILGIGGPTRVNPERVLAPEQLARIVMETVARFCHSADERPGRRHLPSKPGIDDPASMAALAAAVVPFAGRAWDDLSRREGQLKFTHDCYLKAWQLSHPTLPAEFVLLDEAQDANPVVADVVGRQRAQRILVGDRSQAIYGWRGAVDAMTGFQGKRVVLSQSFRFGEAIATEANKWLTLLEAPLRLRGFEPVHSTLGQLEAPDAILCRTNAEAVSRVVDAFAAGRRPALVGGGAEIRALADAAVTLKAGLGCSHPELFVFKTWGELQEYCLAPGTRLLTRDLRWRPIESLMVGDELVGFDEENVAGNGGRRFRTAQVTSAKALSRPCYRVTLDDGRSVVASEEHRWLVRSGRQPRWCRTRSLYQGSRIISVGPPWEEDHSKEAGWLAGIFDGEGSIGSKTPGSYSRELSMAQKEGPTIAAVRRLLSESAYAFSDYPHGTGVRQLALRGSLTEKLRFLGTVRPERLVAIADRLWAGRRVERLCEAIVTSVEPVGELGVIALGTTEHTFVAEGLLSHNCENDAAGADLKVFVRLIDSHGPETVIDTMNRLVDERRADVVVSTAHKAKGREWGGVRIAGDFQEPKELSPAELMLAYVAVTRAKLVLDRGGLAWVDGRLPGAEPAEEAENIPDSIPVQMQSSLLPPVCEGCGRPESEAPGFLRYGRGPWCRGCREAALAPVVNQ